MPEQPAKRSYRFKIHNRADHKIDGQKVVVGDALSIHGPRISIGPFNDVLMAEKIRKALNVAYAQGLEDGTASAGSQPSKKEPRRFGAVSVDAGRPEADVIAAATRFEEADRQFMELDRNNPWFGHYREIVIDERIKAMKDICEAVVHLRDGSGGAVAALEKGGEE